MSTVNLMQMPDQTAAVEAYLDSLPVKKQASLRKLWAVRQKYGHGILAYWFPEFLGMVWVEVMESGKVSISGFCDRKSKPNLWFYLPSEERATSYIQEWAAVRMARYQREQAEKDAWKQMDVRKSFALGDVFVSSWGYEQTNINYYEVVGFKGTKTVLLREIFTKQISNDGYGGKCVPDVGNYRSETVLAKRVSEDGSIRISSCMVACKKACELVDGKKVYAADHWTAYY